MKKILGKRILAVFLAVFMVLSVLSVQALAGSMVWNSSVKIKEATFGWSADGEPVASVKYETPDGQLGEDICLLEPCVPGKPEKDLPKITVDGSEYYLCSYHTINNENPSQYQVNLDGTTTVTANPLSLFTGVSLTEGTTMGLCVEIQKGETYSTSESVYTDVYTFTVPEKEEDEWVWVYNELMHWEKCIKGANTGSERSEGQHVFSETNKKKLYIDTSSYSPLRPLSAQNSPVLLDDDGGRYVFDGTGFTDKNNNSTQSDTALTTYYASNFAGVNFRDYYVTATPCSECSYLGFDLDTDRAVFETDNFTASIDNPVTAEGQWVYLTVDGIAEGVDLSVTATDGAGNAVELTKQALRVAGPAPQVYTYQMPASNVTITIAEQATLTYDANNGEGNVPEAQTAEKNTSVAVGDGSDLYLSDEGLPFVYWNTEADGSGTTYFCGDSFTLTEDTTLYAQYGGILFIDVPADYVTSIGEPFILIDLTDYGFEGDDFYVYGLPAAVGDDLTAAKTAIENAEINVNVNNVELSGWMYLDAGSQSILALDSLPATMPQTNLIVAIPTFALTGSFAVGDTITVPPTMAATYWENDWDFDEDWKFELDAGVYTLEYVEYNPVDPEYPDDPDCHTFLIVDTQDEDNYHYLDLNANGVSDKPWGVTCVSGTGTEDEPYLFEVVPGYTVTYDGNGATGGEAPVDGKVYQKDNRVVTLAHGTLEKTGYSFKEWNTAADGSGTAYAERSSFIIAGKTTLYAQWTEKSGSDESSSYDSRTPIGSGDGSPSGYNTSGSGTTGGSTDTKTDAPVSGTDGGQDSKYEHDPDNVIERTEAAKPGDVINVKMTDDDTVLPAEAIENARKKGLILVIELPIPGLTWTIDGKDIEDPKDVDLGASFDADGIPVEVINKVTGERYYITIHLNYDGEFGFTATLTVDLGLTNAGLFANLFWYNPVDLPEFIDATLIDENGLAEFKMSHASDYFIIIDVMAYGDTEAEISIDGDDDDEVVDINPGTETSTGTAGADENNPHTGVAVGGMVAFMLSGIAVTVTKKRRNK